jgi:hypothetical protein
MPAKVDLMMNLREKSIASWDYSYYLLLLVPIILFLVSLYIPPLVISDSGVISARQYVARRSLQQHHNARSEEYCQRCRNIRDWWSPGNILRPVFLFGSGQATVALSLTTLIATLLGVVG